MITPPSSVISWTVATNSGDCFSFLFSWFRRSSFCWYLLFSAFASRSSSRISSFWASRMSIRSSSASIFSCCEASVSYGWPASSTVSVIDRHRTVIHKRVRVGRENAARRYGLHRLLAFGTNGTDPYYLYLDGKVRIRVNRVFDRVRIVFGRQERRSE